MLLVVDRPLPLRSQRYPMDMYGVQADPQGGPDPNMYYAQMAGASQGHGMPMQGIMGMVRPECDAHGTQHVLPRGAPRTHAAVDRGASLRRAWVVRWACTT